MASTDAPAVRYAAPKTSKPTITSGVRAKSGQKEDTPIATTIRNALLGPVNGTPVNPASGVAGVRGAPKKVPVVARGARGAANKFSPFVDNGPRGTGNYNRNMNVQGRIQYDKPAGPPTPANYGSPRIPVKTTVTAPPPGLSKEQLQAWLTATNGGQQNIEQAQATMAVPKYQAPVLTHAQILQMLSEMQRRGAPTYSPIWNQNGQPLDQFNTGFQGGMGGDYYAGAGPQMYAAPDYVPAPPPVKGDQWWLDNAAYRPPAESSGGSTWWGGRGGGGGGGSWSPYTSYQYPDWATRLLTLQANR